MLFWIGAALAGYLGYRLLPWWVPAALACAVVVVQAVLFQTMLGNRGPGLDLLALSLAMNLLMFHATFGIGRAIALRFTKRGKGAK